ncbi:MAG: AAA family ATPase [Hyphomicrobiales bacterium]|nr:AAA family ATPase [Hyphomicrobiales bacterium]
MIHQTTTLAGTNESQDREAKIIDFGRSLQRRRSPFGLQVFRADNDVVSAVADIPTPSIPTDIPQDARWFIELLTGDADTPVNWRAFIDDDNDPRKKDDQGRKTFGTLADVFPTLQEWQRDGRGIYIVVNEGGDTDKDITSIRSLFIDQDDGPLPDEWHVKPSFLVKRNAKKWHAYWPVDGLPADEFRAAQKRLIAHYNSDKSIHNPSRVMRVPGFLHLKDRKSPQVPRLVIDGYPAKGAILMGPRGSAVYQPSSVLSGLKAPVTEATPEARTSPEGVELDRPEDIARAARYLENVPGSISGQHGNDNAYAVFAKLKDFGISEELAPTLAKSWNENCIPPWSANDLKSFARNAYNHGQNEPGCDSGAAQIANTIKAATGQDPVFSPAPERNPFLFGDDCSKNIRQTWLIDEVVPATVEGELLGSQGRHGLLTAREKTGKTFLAVDMAAHIALGEDWNGRAVNKGNVLYVAAEDAQGVRNRLAYWLKYYDREAPENFAILPETFLLANDCKNLCDLIDKYLAPRFQPDFIVYDTLSKGLHGSANEDEIARQYMDAGEALSARYKATVLSVGHTSKKNSGDDISTLGSVQFQNNADFQLALRYARDLAPGERPEHDEPVKFYVLQGKNYTEAPEFVLKPVAVPMEGSDKPGRVFVTDDTIRVREDLNKKAAEDVAAHTEKVKRINNTLANIISHGGIKDSLGSTVTEFDEEPTFIPVSSFAGQDVVAGKGRRGANYVKSSNQIRAALVEWFGEPANDPRLPENSGIGGRLVNVPGLGTLTVHYFTAHKESNRQYLAIYKGDGALEQSVGDDGLTKIQSAALKDLHWKARQDQRERKEAALAEAKKLRRKEETKAYMKEAREAAKEFFERQKVVAQRFQSGELTPPPGYELQRLVDDVYGSSEPEFYTTVEFLNQAAPSTPCEGE